MESKLKHYGKIIGLQIGLILFILVVVEVALQIYWRNDGGVVRSGWVSAAWPCGNELGFLGDSIRYTPQDKVFLLIGDSQVAADYCTCDSLPSRILQNRLQHYLPNAKVFSIGSSGYGNDQQLLHFKKYLKTYRADHVILWQTFSNDVWNNMWPTHWPANGTLKPTYWLDDEGKIQGPNHVPDEIVLGTSPFKLVLLSQRAYYGAIGWDKAWEDAHFPPPYASLTKPDGEFSDKWDVMAREFPEQREENLVSEKTHMNVGFIPESERLAYGLRLTRLLLDSIAHLATTHGATFNMLDVSVHEDSVDLDTALYLWDGLYYRYSEGAVRVRKQSLNSGLNPLYLPITRANWKVSERNSHLNCRTVHLMMTQLADSLANNLGRTPSISNQVPCVRQ
jgi:hypothetical protein